MLDVKKLLAKILTCCYSTGTDGIWAYRKYGDHTYHAWCVSTINLNAGTAWAGGYFHKSSSSLTPPSFSQSVISMSGTVNSAVLTIFCGYIPNTLESYWYNGVASASNNLAVRLDLYGTW